MIYLFDGNICFKAPNLRNKIMLFAEFSHSIKKCYYPSEKTYGWFKNIKKHINY